MHPLLFFMWLLSALVLFLFLCFLPTTPHFFFSFHCYPSVTGAQMSLCGGHSWVAGIASHGSVLPFRDSLITVEALGHPGHPPSTQLDAVVNIIYSMRMPSTKKGKEKKMEPSPSFNVETFRPPPHLPPSIHQGVASTR